MKTRYKFVHFEQFVDPESKVLPWACLNNRSGDCLAMIVWYAPWKQWVMATNEDAPAVFSADCLVDIQKFIGQLAVTPLARPVP